MNSGTEHALDSPTPPHWVVAELVMEVVELVNVVELVVVGSVVVAFTVVVALVV